MTEYFKKFTMDKDEVTIIDFGENEVFECKYPDEAKSLCNRLNDLDYEKYNLKKENEQLKSKYSEQCTQLDFLKDENQHMRDLVNENKLLKEKLNEILELTEMTGMIHLRKAEIKSIIKR